MNLSVTRMDGATAAGYLNVAAAARLWIILLGQMFLFGLRLVDPLRSPSIHLSLQLLLLPGAAERGKHQS